MTNLLIKPAQIQQLKDEADVRSCGPENQPPEENYLLVCCVFIRMQNVHLNMKQENDSMIWHGWGLFMQGPDKYTHKLKMLPLLPPSSG